MRPVRAKASSKYWRFKAFALTGRQVCVRNYPGRGPGLRASAPSGRAAYMASSSFRAYLNHFAELELLSDGEKIN